MIRLKSGWKSYCIDDSIYIYSDIKKIKLNGFKDKSYEVSLKLNNGNFDILTDKYILESLYKVDSIKNLIESTSVVFDDEFSRIQGYIEHINLDPILSLQKIKNSYVLILGLGGIGTNILQNLLMSGVRRFIIIDFDFVEASNLTRQSLYSYEDIGFLKTDVISNYIKRNYPDAELLKFNVKVDSIGILEEVFNKVPVIDLAIVCADNPPKFIQDITMSFFWNKDIPFINGGVMIQAGVFGPLFDKKFSKNGPESYLNKRSSDINFEPTFPCFSPFNSLISNFIAAEVLHYLLGAYDKVEFDNQIFVDFVERKIIKKYSE